MSDGRSIRARRSADGGSSLWVQMFVSTGPGLTDVMRMLELRYSSISASVSARTPNFEAA